MIKYGLTEIKGLVRTEALADPIRKELRLNTEYSGMLHRTWVKYIKSEDELIRSGLIHLGWTPPFDDADPPCLAGL